jgi:hypothetical protein
MRISNLCICTLLFACFSTPALADKQSYCEVFGQDFANAKTPDVDQWEINFRNAFGDCMAQYSADGNIAAPAKKVATKAQKVVVVPARDFSRKKRVSILTPGSIAWNNYCASKYASFNPVTGNYRSKTGQQKPCLTPSD